MSGEDLQRSVWMIQWGVFGKVPSFLPCFSADGQWQRWLPFCLCGEWKMITGHAPVCEAWLQDLSPHATASFFPLLALMRSSCQSTPPCLRAAMPRAVSISHPASILGLFSLCWITGVSSQPAHPSALRSWKIFSFQLIIPRDTTHDRLFSRVGWHEGRFKILHLHVYFCKNIDLLFYYYTPLSGPKGPTGVRGILLPASPYTRKSQWLDEQCWIYSHFHVFFSVSGRNLPFGARKSGIGEGKVLLRPEAQQCVCFD